VEESGTSGEGRGLVAKVAFVGSLLFAGGLHAVAFPPFDFAEAAYIFAVPLFVCVLAGLRIRGEMALLFVAGWMGWMVGLSWLRHCTDHLSGWHAGILGWLAVAGLSAVVSVFWTFGLWLAMRVLRHARGKALPGRLGAMLAVAALWVVVEWLRGWILGGFPWLTLSISQWQRPVFLQVASLTGAAGISFTLMLFNAGLAFYFVGVWRNRRRTWWKRLSWEFYFALAVLFMAVGYGLSQSGAGGRQSRLEGPRVAFVQPNTQPMEKWDQAAFEENLSVLEDLSRFGGLLQADLILWPEAATALPVIGNEGMRDWVEGLARRVNAPLLVGNMAVEPSADSRDRLWYNTVCLVDPQRGLQVAYYAKRKLVPFGEYVPLADLLPFLRAVVPLPGDLSAGTRPVLLEPSVAGRSFGRVGPLVCFEDIFPDLARANVRAGADWHFVVTNNAWFGEASAGRQHAAHSVMRAVETRRPVVRCGNAGWSGIIDEFGHIRHQMVDDTGSIYFQGVQAATLTRSHWWAGRQSLYVRWGDWFIAFCAFIGAIGFALVRFCGPAGDKRFESRATRQIGRRRLFE
jgi:apolipoprotein N-acyltransferase